MNAITVNYAEVGDDHLPRSFGLVRNIDLNNQTVYNSNITKITETNYSILQGRDIGTKDIIVSSDTKSSRLLSNFTSGPTSWINHKIPASDSTAYIFYKDDGYYYKMVENENGKPVQTKYAPYAYLTNVTDNAGIQPYCEATIETPVELQVSAGSVKAVINNVPVEIAPVSSSLNLQLENANDDNFTSQSVESEYTIDSDFNLENIEWTRDTQAVSPWLSDNKIIKSSKTVNEMVNQIKLLAGTNLVKIFRKRSDYNVKFNFNGNTTFDTVGTYCNGKEESSFNSGTKTLTIPNVKYGRTLLQYSDFFGGIIDGTVFSPVSIPNPFNGNSGEVTVTINVTDTVDYIRFTGWRGDSLVTEDLPCSHGYISQQPTQYSPDINLTYLDRIDVTGNGGLLTWKSANIFERHRQIYHRKYEKTKTFGDFDENRRQTINETIVNDSIYVPDSDYEKGSIGNYLWKEYWDYSQENYASKTFVATAHYNNIPAAVSVTTPNNQAAASSNQVVLFEGAYYVADPDMKSRVESLVSGVTVTAQKEITRYTNNWSTTIHQTYYEVTENIQNSSTQTSHQDTTGAISAGTETSYTYTSKTAAINIYGFGSQVTSIASTDSNITVQLSSQYLNSNTNRLVVIITYYVSAGFSLTSRSPSDYRVSSTKTISPDTWNKVLTYKFFN